MTETLDDFLRKAIEGPSLAHWGVRGMKWGVRRTPEQLQRAAIIRTDGDSNAEGKRAVLNTRTGRIKPTSKDYDVKKELGARLQEFGPSTLSNQEMQAYMQRLNLEQQYARISAPAPTKAEKGAKFAKETIKKVGKNEFNSLLKGNKGPVVKLVTGEKGKTKVADIPKKKKKKKS